MGQQAAVTGGLGELPLRQAQHKAGVGLRQAHAAGSGKDDAVHALGDMPHVAGAQKQREQVGVLGGGKHRALRPRQAHHLVQQGHDHVPLPQSLVGGGQLPRRAQLLRQGVQGVGRAQGFQKAVDAPGQRRHVGAFGAVRKPPDAGHQKGAGLLGQGQLPGLLRIAAGVVAAGAAGELGAPVRGRERPGIGVVFQRALGFGRKVDQAGLDQPQDGGGIDAAPQQVQRRVDGAGGGGVFRGGGLVAEQWDAR